MQDCSYKVDVTSHFFQPLTLHGHGNLTKMPEKRKDIQSLTVRAFGFTWWSFWNLLLLICPGLHPPNHRHTKREVTFVLRIWQWYRVHPVFHYSSAPRCEDFSGFLDHSFKGLRYHKDAYITYIYIFCKTILHSILQQKLWNTQQISSGYSNLQSTAFQEDFWIHDTKIPFMSSTPLSSRSVLWRGGCPCHWPR